MKELDRTGGPNPARRHSRKKAGGKRYAASDPKGQRRLVLQSPLRLLGVLVAVCALVGVIFALDYLTTGDEEIQRGVVAAGTPVGGMTEDQARDAIARRAGAAFEEVEFKSGKDTFALPGKDLGLKVDAAAAAGEAYAVGRRSGPFQRLSDVLGAYLGGGVDVAADVGFDAKAARGALEGLARDKFDRKPKDASFSADDAGKVTVVDGQTGRTLDVEATMANLDRALNEFGGEKGVQVALAAEEKAPGLTTEEARALAPTELVGEYKTDFAWDPDPARQANLKKASGAIDNTLLAPGETFSAIKVLEPLDYEQAKVFADGGVSYGVGGGLCQVSSTLYMAASYAGLEIVERNAHYAMLPYIRPGFDATVWFGGSGVQPLDMKFKNNTGGYVLIREFVDKDGFLTARIYEQKPTGISVQMNSEKVEEDLQKGITWATSKKVTGKDGKVLFDGNLYQDTYSYNPPVPADMQHDTNEPRTSSWVDPTNTTGWAKVN